MPKVGPSPARTRSGSDKRDLANSAAVPQQVPGAPMISVARLKVPDRTDYEDSGRSRSRSRESRATLGLTNPVELQSPSEES